MASAVADLEAGLQAMLNLKPPGVSGSRINNLTALCVANIKSESVLIQKIYTHFKKTPGTHKLGVLYVVDSVTRKWMEQAKSQGQAINGAAQDGTYAAGVHRVTELMPVLMNDIISTIPEEQKEKIKKLLDIWEKAATFPASLIESCREKLNAPPPQKDTTTPPGSPPPNPLRPTPQTVGAAAPLAPGPTASGSSILEALANIARQNTTSAPSNSALPAPAASYSMPAANLPQPVSSFMPQQPQQQQSSYSSSAQPVNMSSLPFPLSQLQPGGLPNSANALNPYGGGVTAAGPAGASASSGASGLDQNTQQQILLIKALADQGVPFDKIPALIQSMTGSVGNGAVGSQASASLATGQNPYGGSQFPWLASAPGPADGHARAHDDVVRSPPRYGRTRSRSPDREWGGRNSPRGGRESLEHGRDSPRGRHGDRSDGRRGADYRQRSPQRRYDHSPSPPEDLPRIEKWVEYDSSLPSGNIKVLSRTLFVGGVTCSEAQLRSIFSRYGTVQTCIVNREKRHAFVKMLSRKDAVTAKDGTEDTRNLEVQLRTRWGVGFGPRDCSDYSTGISIIPIQRLTEADRKWMLTAPYGGSGGRPIETGLCVEEPDIEIGAGVSSKAISRRMQTDKGGSNGPKSTRHRDEESGRSGRRGDRNGRDTDGGRGKGDQNNDSQPHPVMTGFPFGIGTLPNGMPNFPAGFAFPDPSPGQ